MKAVIMAGGSGSRLWPVSRKGMPKQFQKLISSQTMLQETIDRLDFLSPSDIFISTNEDYKKIVIEQSKQKKIPNSNIIIEPALRDTAPGIGLAAAYIASKHPKEVMAVIYADHLIQNKKEFKQKLKIAAKIAEEEKTLNIIEVKAKYPNVNLGYVKIDKPLGTIDGTQIYSFDGFREKPSHEEAKKFVESYKYLWNTGLYVWRVDVILNSYKKHLPNTYALLKKIQENIGSDKEQTTLKKLYPKCDKISIDYGIMEKVAKSSVRIIPAELGWSDVGTWQSIMEEVPHNRQDNIIKSNHIGIDTNQTLIYSAVNGKLIATIGVEDLIIVDTKDALLICKKNRSHDVKKIVENLIQKKNKRKYI
jgi:mannose-1-phosphate guanylyltransferase